MKTLQANQQYFLMFLILISIICARIEVNAQASEISAPFGTQMVMTDYADPSLPEDQIFIFCSPDGNGYSVTGTLSVIGGYVNCLYDWKKFNPETNQFEFFGAPTGSGFASTINGLASGLYQCIVTSNPGTPYQYISYRRAHVFVNETVLTLDSIQAGCNSFT